MDSSTFITLAINMTNQSGITTRDWLSTSEKAVALTFIYMLDIVMIVGNFLVILIFIRDTQLHITCNFYICSLTAADLILAVFVIPIYSSTILLGDWYLGLPLCIIWLVLDEVSLINSYLCILLFTYDRFILAKDALWYTSQETPQRAHC